MIKQLFIHSTRYFVLLVCVKLVSTIIFLLLARALQPELFGTLSYFLTILSLTTLVADFGLIQWYQKTVATSDQTHTTLTQLIEARLFTLLFSMGVISIFLAISTPFSGFITALFLITLLPESLISVFDGYYLFHKQSQKLALKQFSKIIFLPLVFLLPSTNGSFLNQVISMYTLGSFFTVAWFIPWHKVWRELTISHHSLKTLSDSKDYGFLLVASAVYSRGDTIVIDQIAGRQGVGLYSAAYRYLEVVNLLPTALAQNLFHISAKPKQLTITHLFSIVGLMGVIGAVVSALLFSSAELLTVGLLGQSFAESATVLRILSLAVFFFFVNAPLSTVVQSSHQLRKFLPWGMANTLFNIVLNILLIPQYGITAAAWVMMCTEVSGCLINVYFVMKQYQDNA